VKRINDKIVRALTLIHAGWIPVEVVGERYLGRPLTKPEIWAAGSRMAALWKEATGLPNPVFAYVDTRSGSGNHLKAVYPPEWESDIQGVISTIATNMAFADDAPPVPAIPADPNAHPLDGTPLGNLFD